MFHRVVLPKNRVEFHQQFDGDISFTLTIHYDLVRRRTKILFKMLITIVFFICCRLCYVCASKELPTNVPFTKVGHTMW